MRSNAIPLLVVLATLLSSGLGCVGQNPAPGGNLAVNVAPLTLEGVTDATYTLTVVNADGDVVWTRGLTSDAFGDGAGSLSYVGTCDADRNPNRVDLVVDALEAGGVTLVSGVDWVNPAPPGDPVSRTVTCVADADVSVTFDLSLARAAEQGFFDVALSFSDVFCSAKLDCLKDTGAGPTELELLTNPLTGARDRTAVLGFACTAGPGQDTVLHMNPLAVACDSGQTASVDPSGGPGNLDPPFPGPAPNTTDLLFQAATFRGVEQLGDYRKAYWNIALGLNREALPAPAGCRLTTTATVSDGAMVAGVTPAGTRWPYVSWDVLLYDAGGAYVCSQHAAGDGNGVDLVYSATSGTSFSSSFDYASQQVTTHTCPDGTTGATCTLTPRLWYRADALALSDGATVTSWPDEGSANQTLTPMTGTPPTFLASAVNGLPAVRFAQGGPLITTPFFLQEGSNDFTFYAILEARPTQGYGADILDNQHGGSNDDTAAGPVWQQDPTVGPNAMGIAYWSPAPASTYTGLGPWEVSTTEFTLHQVVKSGTTMEASVNGTLANSRPDALLVLSQSTTGVPFALGGNTLASLAGRAWNGDMAELVYFNRALTPAERADMTQVLASKYGITLP